MQKYITIHYIEISKQKYTCNCIHLYIFIIINKFPTHSRSKLVRTYMRTFVHAYLYMYIYIYRYINVYRYKYIFVVKFPCSVLLCIFAYNLFLQSINVFIFYVCMYCVCIQVYLYCVISIYVSIAYIFIYIHV